MAEDGAALDGILAQWRRERPDLNTDCMLVCGAVWRAGRRLMDGLKENLDRYGLDFPGMAKLYATDEAQQVIDDAVQLFGGHGAAFI